ncbi:MAG: ABC transporter ATP-binding protein, partial [Cyanobacteria bacterium J06648_11]
YLEDFGGCVVTVSHDRYFLDRAVNKIFEIAPGGVVKQYPGNYSVYLDYKAAEIAESDREAAETLKADEAKSVVASSKPKSSRARKLSYKERRELETLETRIPELEEQKVAIEKELYGQSSGSGFTDLTSLSEQLAAIDRDIDTSTERWLELSEIAEAS